MTGFGKVVPNHTRNKIQLIACNGSYTLALSRHTNRIPIDSQVCFTDDFLLTLDLNHEGVLQCL